MPALLLSVVCWLPVQGEAERPKVYLADSVEALSRLDSVQRYVEQREYAEAAGLLQQLIERFPDKLVPATAPPVLSHVNLRTWCHHRIATLPPEALAAYRRAVDGQASALLARVPERGPLNETQEQALRRIVGAFYCSSVGDEALERLGEEAFLRGSYAAALRWWAQLLPPDLRDAAEPNRRTEVQAQAGGLRLSYPDSDLDPAAVAGKWAVAALLAGDAGAAGRMTEALRARRPDAAGPLAGRKGVYWRTLQELAGSDEVSPPRPGGDWPTFAGNFRRDRAAPRALQAGDVEHSWPLEGDEDDPPAHPVLVGDTAYLARDGRIHEFHLRDGRTDTWGDGLDGRFGGAGAQTLTVAGPHLLTRSGGGLESRRQRFGGQTRVHESLLQCYERDTQRKLWQHRCEELVGAAGYVFEGVPVVQGDAVWVAVTRLGAMAEAAVLCLDRETGTLRWRTSVCESSVEDIGEAAAMHNLLTLAGGRLFYATNLGAVAALDAADGALQWVATYNRQPNRRSAREDRPPVLNPCVFDHGRLYVAPADHPSVRCYDADSGGLLWQASAPLEHLLGVADGRLVGTGDRVWALDAASGKVRWYWPENLARSQGRGLLAGGKVLWPTATDVHVLDVASGRKAAASIPLQARFGVAGGNLLIGADHLLVATPQRLVALYPYSRLIDGLKGRLVLAPGDATLHLRLAESAAAVDDWPLAETHYADALRLAEPDADFRGRPLVAYAAERLYRTLRRHADAVPADDPAAADALLVRAAAAAPQPADRLAAVRRRAQLAESNDDPVVAVALHQSILDDDALASLPVAGADGISRPAARVAAERQAALMDQHGDRVYGAVARAAERALAAMPEAASADRWLALASRYAHAPATAGGLLAAARGFAGAGRPRDARVLLKELAARAGAEADVQRQGLVELERGYAAAGAEWAAAGVRRRLESRFAAAAPVALPDGSTQTLGAYLKSRHAPPPAPPAVAPVWLRQWQTEHRDRRVVVPSGRPALDAPLLSVADDRLQAATGPDADALWRKPVLGAVTHCVRLLGGLVVIDDAAIRCLDETDGTMLWAQPLPAPVSVVHELDDAVALATAGELRLLDGDTGRTRWSAALPEPLTQDRADAAGPYGLSSARGDSARGDSARGTPNPGADSSDEGVGVGASGDGDPNADGSAGSDDSGPEVGGDSGPDRPGRDREAVPLLQRTEAGVLVSLADRRLLVDGLDGAVRHEFPCEPGVATRPAVVLGDRLVMLVAADRAVAYDRGQVLWERALERTLFAPPRLLAAGDGVLVVADGQRLQLLAADTGSLLWEQAIAERPAFDRDPPLALAAAGVLHRQSAWLVCRSLDDGAVRWRRPLPPGDGWRLRTLGDRFLLHGADGAVHLGLADTGDWIQTLAVESGPLDVALDAGRLVVSGGAGSAVFAAAPTAVAARDR